MDRQKMLRYFANYSPLHSERAQRWDKKRPFFAREHALLADRRPPPPAGEGGAPHKPPFILHFSVFTNYISRNNTYQLIG